MRRVRGHCMIRSVSTSRPALSDLAVSCAGAFSYFILAQPRSPALSSSRAMRSTPSGCSNHPGSSPARAVPGRCLWDESITTPPPIVEAGGNGG
jgi:hypothetical protein